MRYPVSSVFTYDINIGKHVFNRTYDNKTEDLVGASYIAYYFTVFLSSGLRKIQVNEFETIVSKFVFEN